MLDSLLISIITINRNGWLFVYSHFNVTIKNLPYHHQVLIFHKTYVFVKLINSNAFVIYSTHNSVSHLAMTHRCPGYDTNTEVIVGGRSN
jgi:hypothetical protein